MHDLISTALVSEYRNYVNRLPISESNELKLHTMLVSDGDWSPRGATEVIGLAQKYGTSILRNALALAAALEIEDGTSGL